MRQVATRLSRGLLALLLALALLAPTGGGETAAGDGELLVYIVVLDGSIDAGQYRFLRRALEQAHAAGADLVLLDIHTLGGWLDAALDMRDAMIFSRTPVWTFVRARAWSAGAIIAVAGERLAMAPGASIGAAEPRPAEEKVISAWRTELEETASLWGRDPQVAAAMADSSVAIPGLVEAGRLLTLKASDALELGFADAVGASRDQVLVQLGVTSYTTVEVGPTPAERLASWVTGPVVAPLLLTLGLLALVLELFVPGFGVPGLIGISSLVLYFGGHMLAGFAGWEVLALFTLGLLLLAAEVFVSGFGVLGLGGAVALLSSIVLAAPTPAVAVRSLLIALGVSMVAIVALLRYGRRFTFWSKLVLLDSERPESGYLAVTAQRELLGQRGRAVTPLRPAGTVDLGGRLYDVVAEGGYVATGTEVDVSQVVGRRIVVRAVAPPVEERGE